MLLRLYHCDYTACYCVLFVFCYDFTNATALAVIACCLFSVTLLALRCKYCFLNAFDASLLRLLPSRLGCCFHVAVVAFLLLKLTTVDL
ncbi:hypothetical protein COP1_022907 [Malus domestica]